MTDFIAMGGYAKYVWTAFGISLVMLVATIWLSKRNLAQTRKRVLRKIRATEGTPK